MPQKCGPPRNSAAMSVAPTIVSAMKVSFHTASRRPVYSTSEPVTISVLACGISKGTRSSLPMSATSATRKPSGAAETSQRPSAWARVISLMFQLPAARAGPRQARKNGTS